MNGAFNLQSVLPDPIMSQISMERMGSGDFIADLIAPVAGVTTDYGEYVTYGSEAITQIFKLRRAPGASANTGIMSRTYDKFTCVEDAQKIKLAEEDFQGQDPASVRIQAIDTNITTIKIAIESRIQQQVVAIPHAVTVGTKWDAATPTIYKDWLGLKESFRRQYGVYPNRAVISPTIANIMEEDPGLKDMVKYTAKDALEQGILPPEMMGVGIIVPICNVKESLAAAALSDIWDNGEKSITFLHVESKEDYNVGTNRSSINIRTVNTWMLQIRSTAAAQMTIATRQWVDPDQSAKSEWISCDLKQTEKIVNPALGMRIRVLT